MPRTAEHITTTATAAAAIMFNPFCMTIFACFFMPSFWHMFNAFAFEQ